MTLPSSGPISIGDIRDEFGGTGARAISTYYRGGGLVPNHESNSSIPASGPTPELIKLSNFRGTSKFFRCEITAGFSFGQNGYRDDSIVTYGSVTFSGIEKYGTNTVVKFNNFWIDGFTGIIRFGVEGLHTGSWWNTIIYDGQTGTRVGTGEFGAGNTTRWEVSFVANPGLSGTRSFEIRP